MNRVLLILLIAFPFIAATAQSLQQTEDYEVKVKYYTEKIRQEPDSLINYYLRATFILNNFDASNADFKKALELYLRHPSQQYARTAADACYFLSDHYYFRNSDRATAQEYISQGLSIIPGDKKLEVMQTCILSSYREKEEEARMKFDSLITKYPEDEKLLLYYGNFIAKHDEKKAAPFYEKVVTINPKNTDALFALGSYYTNEAKDVYQATGDARKGLELSKKGLAYFETVHQLKPNDKDLMEILIQCYNNMDLDTEKAQMEQKLRQ